MEQTKNFVLKKTNKHHEDIHKTSDIIHLLGKKVLMDGYNFKEKHFISKWYIYDWFINVFFNKSNVTIKSDIIDKIEHLVNEFDENKEVHEKVSKALVNLKNGIPQMGEQSDENKESIISSITKKEKVIDASTKLNFFDMPNQLLPEK